MLLNLLNIFFVMFLFNNSRILKSGSDVTLGSVYSETENFNFEIYQNLIIDKIQDLIDLYVGERLKLCPKGTTQEDILTDLAAKIGHRLNVSVMEADIYGISQAITESERYQTFLSNVKEGFDRYEGTFDTSSLNPYYSVPVTFDQSTESFYSENNVGQIYDETNIEDFIEVLSTYNLPIFITN